MPEAPDFSLAGTIACALLLGALALLVIGYLKERYPFTRLNQPVISVPHYWGHELDAAPVAAERPTWQRVMVLASLSSERELLDATSKDLQALMAMIEQGTLGDAPAEAMPIRARLAVTLGAAGRWAELDRLPGAGSDELKTTVSAAWGRGPLPAADVRQRALAAFVAAPFEQRRPDWWQDQLTARLAARQGDAAAARAAVAASRARGQRIVRNALWLAPLLLIPLLGLGLGVAALWRRRIRPPIPGPLGRAEIPLPFPGRYGLALLLRAALLGMLAGIPVLIAQYGFGVKETGVLALASFLPMIFLLRRVLAAQGRSVGETVGLWPWPSGPWGQVTLILVGAEMTLSLLGGLLMAATDGGGSPSEALIEGVALGTGLEAALVTLEAVVWAPLFEEIAFRGVLYGCLRRRFGVAASAVLSAAVFALLHGYSPVVLSTLGAGAVVSALVYERTRSLWPSILAHFFNNALVVVSCLAVYR